MLPFKPYSRVLAVAASALGLGLLLAGCARDEPAADADATPAAATPKAGIDWAACRIPGARAPVAGKLFVVDGGLLPPGAEDGRESIRRVDVFVPGPVALLLTAPDATAWHLRISPETQLQAVFASGEATQRITGQRLGPPMITSPVRIRYSASCGRPNTSRVTSPSAAPSPPAQ